VFTLYKRSDKSLRKRQTTIASLNTSWLCVHFHFGRKESGRGFGYLELIQKSILAEVSLSQDGVLLCQTG
jgi:hypothetical protein